MAAAAGNITTTVNKGRRVWANEQSADVYASSRGGSIELIISKICELLPVFTLDEAFGVVITNVS